MQLLQAMLILANGAIGLFHARLVALTVNVHGVERLMWSDMTVLLAHLAMFFVVPAIGWRLRNRIPGAAVLVMLGMPIVFGLLLGTVSLSVRPD
jgi:hypothetical protein